jgi:magnesium chelatase subunit I
LLPRSNRGIFALNELPDLAGKVQVGLFNIMQEGDVQIKGYPIRLPLDVVLIFTANPEDYTARGKIITPLKDRIGSEIRTHYPAALEQGIKITEQEAWTRRHASNHLIVPAYIKEIVEEIAFQARKDQRVDKRSGVSQRLPITCLENAISNAERRALVNKDKKIVPRIADVYAALPSITGKLELEYEGELQGGENVAKDLIRTAVGQVFNRYFGDTDFRPIVQWFDMGGTLKISDNARAAECAKEMRKIQGLEEKSSALGIKEDKDDPAMVASACEFILEGLYAQKRISRSEEKGYTAAEKKRSDPYYEDYERTKKPYKKHFN